MAAFYLDNDVSTGIAGELTILGHAATTALAQQLRRASDAQHLLTATQHDWVLVGLLALLLLTDEATLQGTAGSSRLLSLPGG